MSVLVVDAGNSIIKAKTAGREKNEVVFPHALSQITESEFNNIHSRSKAQRSSQDYLRVNGTPYVIGVSAERYGINAQRSGAARYTWDYYGVLAAAALARLYERSREIMIFGSHAPGDAKFRDDLMKAVVGDWQVETADQDLCFRVTYANTFDEPVGGLMNVLLTEDGQHYQHSEITGGRSLVVDNGGFTTDWLAVNPGGVVDYSLARSVPTGIQSVLVDFEESFRANNLQAIKNTPVLPAERLRKAMVTGYFEGGGKRYPCENEAREATNVLLNRIADTYQRISGGALGWDAIILTGGGCGLLYKRLLPILSHEHLILADDLESLHLANVRGGLKLWRLYEALKVV